MIAHINLAMQMILWAYVAWKDYKTKKVSVKCCVFLGIFGCAAAIYNKTPGLEIVSGAGIGILFLALAYMSSERIGYGDGICITAMGLWLGGTRMVSILCLAMFTIVIVGGILLMMQKVTKKSRMPMVPFLYIALCMRILNETLDKI